MKVMGDEAMVMAERNELDIFLLDMDLGAGMNGADLCKRLRLLPRQ